MAKLSAMVGVERMNGNLFCLQGALQNKEGVGGEGWEEQIGENANADIPDVMTVMLDDPTHGSNM